MNKFGKYIKQARKNEGLTLNELSKITGFTTRAILYWEKGEREISLKNAEIILKALNRSLIVVGKGGINESIQ